MDSVSDDWPSFSLEDCVEAFLDYRGKTPEKTSSGVPLITAKVVKDGRIAPTDEFIAADQYDQWMTRGLPRTGDVVMTTEAPLGEVAQLTESRVALAQRIIVLRGKAQVLDNGFLKYSLLSQPVQEQLQARASGTTVVGIKQSELRRVTLRLPRIEVQRAIAHIPGTLDDKIELNRRMNETLEAMARVLFKSWFVDFDPVRAKAEGLQPSGMDAETAKLFPSEFVDSELGPIPKGWAATTLGAEAKRCGGAIQTGPFGSQLHASDYVAEGVPVVMPKDIVGRSVLTASIARVEEADASRLSRHRLKAGDIVYSRRGDVERHALISARESGWLCGTGCLLVRLGGQWPSPLFTSLALDLPETRAWISQHAIGATMPNLNTGILEKVPFVAPTDDVISTFARVVGPLQSRIQIQQDESATLAELRNTLLPRLLSGELSVSTAEDLVESAHAPQ
jgi:type I restriction enzyme S subunit